MTGKLIDSLITSTLDLKLESMIRLPPTKTAQNWLLELIYFIWELRLFLFFLSGSIRAISEQEFLDFSPKWLNNSL